MHTKRQSGELLLCTCYHCGNTGLLKIEHIYPYVFGGPIYDECGNFVDAEPTEKFWWYLLSCPVCNKATLYQEYEFEFEERSYVYLYPKITDQSEGFPSHIKSAYDSAMKVKNIDSAICLLSLRRALEAICKDKGANGRDLNDMVSDLISRKVLPELFSDACWIIRTLGNSAAHADEHIFNRYEVDKTADFVKSIIDYLYGLPYQINKLKQHIEMTRD